MVLSLTKSKIVLNFKRIAYLKNGRLYGSIKFYSTDPTCKLSGLLQMSHVRIRLEIYLNQKRIKTVALQIKLLFDRALENVKKTQVLNPNKYII